MNVKIFSGNGHYNTIECHTVNELDSESALALYDKHLSIIGKFYTDKIEGYVIERE